MTAIVAAVLLAAQAAATGPPKPIVLEGSSRSIEAVSVLIVSADGMIEQCDPADRPYWNIPSPPDLCSSFAVGTRYSAPAIFHGKPQRRRVTIRLITLEANMK